MFIHRFPLQTTVLVEGVFSNVKHIDCYCKRKAYRLSDNLFIERCLKILENWQLLPNILMPLICYSLVPKLYPGNELTAYRKTEIFVPYVYYVFHGRYNGYTWHDVTVFSKYLLNE